MLVFLCLCLCLCRCLFARFSDDIFVLSCDLPCAYAYVASENQATVEE